MTKIAKYQVLAGGRLVDIAAWRTDSSERTEVVRAYTEDCKTRLSQALVSFCSEYTQLDHDLCIFTSVFIFSQHLSVCTV